jgi:hypothetical protein
MILLNDLGTFPRLGLQLDTRLEVIHIESRHIVQLGQDGSRSKPFKSSIAHHLADNSTVLLLDPGLVILPIGARPGELSAGSHPTMSACCTAWS